MNSLTKGIESAIKSAIEEYVQNISSKYDEIDVDDLEKLWNDISKTMKISVSFKEDKQRSTVNALTSTNAGTEVSSRGCPYKFIKGAKRDQTCGGNAQEGNVYCSRHKKHEGAEQKERKATPDPKRSIVKPKTKSKNLSPVKSIQRVLRKHKIVGKLWHPETGLVFKSAKERIVIGKIVDDNLVDLTDEDYDDCRKWGFSFSPPEDKELEEDSSDDEVNEKDESSTETKIYLMASSSSASGKKFWECKVSGVNYTTRHGKVDKDGTTKSKVFDSNSDALKEMNKMIAIKKKKGYSDDTNESLNTPSDIENVLNELQGSSSDQSDEEKDEVERNLGKKFIADAIGLNKKEVEDDDEGDDMLVEEYEEGDDIEYEE